MSTTALTNYREPEHQKPLADAVAIYLAERTRAFEHDMLSMRQLRSIRNELEALQTHFPKATVCRFTAPILRAYLERGDSVLKTYNNRRGVLSTFFKFAFQHDWIVSNPVEKTPHHRINHRRGSAVTITAEKAKELMAYVETFREASLVTYFAICLFAGVRPCIRGGEIKKLKPESVRLDTGVIHIEPEVSKVRMKRNVTIQPNLAAWLRAYPLAEFPIVPPNSMNTRKEVFEKFALTHDVLRHTFISMFVAKFRSMGEAALQAGNSEAIIRKHYLDLKNPAEAKEYFSILPTRRAAPAATTAEIFTHRQPFPSRCEPSRVYFAPSVYGNTNVIPSGNQTHRCPRSPPLRRFPPRQRTLGAHAPRVDEAAPHPSPPDRAFHLLRSHRGGGAHPGEAEGAAPGRVIASPRRKESRAGLTTGALFRSVTHVCH